MTNEQINQAIEMNRKITIGGFLRSIGRKWVVKEGHSKSSIVPKLSKLQMTYNEQRCDVVIKEVTQAFNTNFKQINNTSRKREVVQVRQCICFFLNKYTTMTYRQIGMLYKSILGEGHGLNHATIIHAIETWSDLSGSVEFRRTHEHINQAIKDRLSEIKE